MTSPPQSWLVIDDMSLLLLIAIVAVLLTSTLITRWYSQPTLHPLILGRQADASQVHSAGESPVYRNANAPHGFDLATKPRKGAGAVKALLQLGAKGDENSASRFLYGKQTTGDDVLASARKFGTGLLNLFSSPRSSALAICVDADHLEALEALLAASLLSDSSTGKNPFDAFVVPPVHLPEGQPKTFPTSSEHNVRLAAVFTTPKAIHKAAAMAIVDRDTVFILATQQDVAEAQRSLGDGFHNQFMSFSDVVGKGSDAASHDEHNPTKSSSQAIVSSYWLGDTWVPVTNSSICAGVTSYLSFYPADGIPSNDDRIWVEQSPYSSSNPPSLHLGATATPAGLTLAIAALYTGASLSTGPLTSSLDDTNPTTSASLQKYHPTLIYASPLGASSLGLALTTLSKRSPIAHLCYNAQLRSLRHGAAISQNATIWDSLLFRGVRSKSGTDAVRGVSIVGRGWVVGQGLLDVLRTHLGCAVGNSYLPAAALRLLVDGQGPSNAVQTTSASDRSDVAVWTTSPVSQSHVYDVQTFRSNNKISEIPAHVGPPSVAVELKVLKDDENLDNGEPRGWDRFISKDDLAGIVAVRGPILTSQPKKDEGSATATAAAAAAGGEEDAWYVTSQSGAFRSNGTLLLLPPSLKQEKAEPTADGEAGGMVPSPTLSSERPAVRAAKEIGAGGEQRRHKGD